MVKTAVTTLEKVGVDSKSLEAYRTIVGDEVVDEIKLVSRNLRDAKLLHVNATEIAMKRYDRVAAVYDFCEAITERFGWDKWRELLKESGCQDTRSTDTLILCLL